MGRMAHVAATIKQFVGNESEFEWMTISGEIAKRPLRDRYPISLSAG